MCAKVKYDVTGVESGQDFDTPVPEDLYTAKIALCEQKESKSSGNPMLALTIEIVKGEYKGRNLWDYIVLNEGSAWKMRQFLEAVGLVKDGKAKGTLDTEKIVGERVLVKVKHESSQEFGTKAKVGSLLAIPESELEAEDDDDFDISDEEAEMEDEQIEGHEDDDDDEEGYDDWSVSELKSELKERGLKSAGKKSALVSRLEADDEDDDGDEPF